jgi:hypothetical protein
MYTKPQAEQLLRRIESVVVSEAGGSRTLGGAISYALGGESALGAALDEAVNKDDRNRAADSSSQGNGGRSQRQDPTDDAAKFKRIRDEVEAEQTAKTAATVKPHGAFARLGGNP